MNAKETALAAEPPADAVLFRSRMEIVRILGEMALEHAVVCAELEGATLFMTRVLAIEAQNGSFLTAYSEEKHANAAALESRTIDFIAQHRGARVEFSASHPQDAVVHGEAAVRWTLPAALVRFQRRVHPRYAAKADVSLRCVADGAGVAPFEARIADISLGGAGIMLYDRSIKLAPGTVLKGCKVMVPGREAVVVDLEVRYGVEVMLPDGTRVNRAGVRFVDASPQLQALVSNFIVALKE